MPLPQELIDEARKLGVPLVTTDTVSIDAHDFSSVRGLVALLEGWLERTGRKDAQLRIESGYENAELVITFERERSESEARALVRGHRAAQEKERSLRRRQYEALRKEFEGDAQG